MCPKGKLLVIGGAEDKGEAAAAGDRPRPKDYKQHEILGELLPPDARKQRIIEVVTTATVEPVELSQMYVRAYERAGYPHIGHLSVTTRDEARDPALVARVDDAHAVLFGGGDQHRLASILGGTPFLDAVRARYRDDPEFILAGTSAGAMAMARLMIHRSEPSEAMLKGTVQITSGFGLIEDCIIDTHFIKRGRFSRLALAVTMNPGCTGIGLGEDTALVIREGNLAECRGSGLVVIIDGRAIGHTNVTTVDPDTPVCVEHLKVHILARGNGYRLREHEFVPSKADLAAQRKETCP